MYTLCVLNRKGGVGKTTTAYNLAYGLAEIGKKTLLLDLDSQSHATKSFGEKGFEKALTLYDVLSLGKKIDLSLMPINDNLDIIPAKTNELKLLDVYLNGKLKELSWAIEPLSRRYDFCVIDCSPSDNNLNDNALCASDYIIIPTECQFYSKDGIAEMIKKVDLIKRDYNSRLEILGFLVTKYNDSFKNHRNILNEMRIFLKKLVFDTIIRQDIRLNEAPEYAQTIFEYDPKSKGCTDYINFIKEVLERSK